MSARVEPWGARRSDQPQCVVQADVGGAVVLDALARAASPSGFRVRQVAGGFDAVRGLTGGYVLSEVVQLPLMTALARVEVQVRVLEDGPGGARVSVTCVAGAGELGASKRVARALTAGVSRLESAGASVRVGEWTAAWERAQGDTH